LQPYVLDVARGTSDRIAQDGTVWGAEWHPSGRELAIELSSAGGSSGIRVSSLSGEERVLVPESAGGIRRNSSWSPDGRVLAYTFQDGSQHDIWTVSPDDPSSAKLLLNGAHSPRFSPDGRWLAYVANAGPGQTHVYVRGYPDGERLRVSTEGGQGPIWAPDGTELLFTGPFDGVQKLMAASVRREGATLRIGLPAPLVDMRISGEDQRSYVYQRSANTGASFDIFPDGQRFVMVRSPETRAREIVLVLNFSEELRRLLPN
jgi:Tol biopolymer transport system component